jgi:hypothetical protein
MPAGSERSAGGPELPVTFRPHDVRVAAVVLGMVLLGVTAAVWLAFPQDVRDAFTTFQRLTVLAFGLAYAAAGHALARSRVDAREEGLHVVNGYRSTTYDWSRIGDVALRAGSPWAMLELADGSTAPLMGIQGSDGGRAVAQARELRRLVGCCR